jgi:uncharacterized protein
MRFAEDSNSTFSIQAIIDDGVVIDDRHITRSVLVCADTLQDWPPGSVTELTAEHMVQCEALQPEIVIVGTGRTQVFPPAEYTFTLQNQGIGVEIMANDAACRTFNVLLSEDRRVVLALMLG